MTTHLREVADRLFAEKVRGIGYCEACGSNRNLQCAHIFSRRYASTRVDFANAVCLCLGCHHRFTVDPLAWEEWCQDYIGQEEWDRLFQVAHGMVKMDWQSEVERLKTDAPPFRRRSAFGAGVKKPR